MSDQCKSCTAKGDAKKCESLECNLHETWIVERLKKEIKDLKTWEGLMKILDDAYPESIFTTELFDNDKRDAGVRIISLLRIVDRLERQINETHDARDLLLEDALKEVDRQRKIIETKENQDISDEARIVVRILEVEDCAGCPRNDGEICGLDTEVSTKSFLDGSFPARCPLEVKRT